MPRPGHQRDTPFRVKTCPESTVKAVVERGQDMVSDTSRQSHTGLSLTIPLVTARPPQRRPRLANAGRA